ncbi:MAG: Bifunctional protein FolD, partial [candidate division WS6 bacterium GW2011_GWA2_37_6]
MRRKLKVSARKTGDKLKYHLVDSTAIIVESTPGLAAFETEIAGIKPRLINNFDIAVWMRRPVTPTTAYLKKLWENKTSAIIPATTKGVLTLLDYYKIPIPGKKVVVIGRSSLVGKPTALA